MEHVKDLKEFVKEIETLITDINFIDTYEELAQKEMLCVRAIQELQRKSIQVQRDLKNAVMRTRQNINNGTVPEKPKAKSTTKKGKKNGTGNTGSKKD